MKKFGKGILALSLIAFCSGSVRAESETSWVKEHPGTFALGEGIGSIGLTVAAGQPIARHFVRNYDKAVDKLYQERQAQISAEIKQLNEQLVRENNPLKKRHIEAKLGVLLNPKLNDLKKKEFYDYLNHGIKGHYLSSDEYKRLGAYLPKLKKLAESPGKVTMGSMIAGVFVAEAVVLGTAYYNKDQEAKVSKELEKKKQVDQPGNSASNATSAGVVANAEAK